MQLGRISASKHDWNNFHCGALQLSSLFYGHRWYLVAELTNGAYVKSVEKQP
jgi:hypothetical protein